MKDGMWCQTIVHCLEAVVHQVRGNFGRPASRCERDGAG